MSKGLTGSEAKIIKEHFFFMMTISTECCHKIDSLQSLLIICPILHGTITSVFLLCIVRIMMQHKIKIKNSFSSV